MNQIKYNIRDGIYDNLDSNRRERWEGGKVTGYISACFVIEQARRGMPFEAWSHYPDPPRVEVNNTEGAE